MSLARDALTLADALPRAAAKGDKLGALAEPALVLPALRTEPFGFELLGALPVHRVLCATERVYHELYQMGKTQNRIVVSGRGYVVCAQVN